jgi:dipeptidyl aminopeptidase/acylaminoacyl peptidase
VVLVAGDTDPGTYYLYTAGVVHELFQRLPGIDPERMSPMHPVSFTARDGLSIHGYLTLPPGVTMRSARGLPLVVRVHGGPFAVRDFWRFQPGVQYLAQLGYAVLQVDFRGSGGHGARFQAAGYGQWGGRMETDIIDAARWAVHRHIADPARLCIFGGSYGGYAALEAVVQVPDLFRCAIGEAGVYDLTLRQRLAATPRHGALKRYLALTQGKDTRQLKAISPVFQVDQIKARVFIAWGGADSVVDPENSRELAAALRKAGKHFTQMYYADEGHGFYRSDHLRAFYARVKDVLAASIGPGERSDPAAPAPE